MHCSIAVRTVEEIRVLDSKTGCGMMKEDRSLTQAEKTSEAGIPFWKKKIEGNSAGKEAPTLRPISSSSGVWLPLGWILGAASICKEEAALSWIKGNSSELTLSQDTKPQCYPSDLEMKPTA